MQYLGGKLALGLRIASYLNYIREPGQVYWEPFVGAASVTQYIKNSPIYCSDKNEYLIVMWQRLMEGWVPPDVVTKEMHQKAKHGEYSPELTSFIGFGCSFGGNWFDVYAKGMAKNRARNYAKEGKIRLLEKVESFQNKQVIFFCSDFMETKPPSDNCLIYCDPPYFGVKEFNKIVGKFDNLLFWEKVRDLEFKGHTVVVSEYNAPDCFTCVQSFRKSDDLGLKKGKKVKFEKLFRYGNHPYFGSETIELW